MVFRRSMRWLGYHKRAGRQPESTWQSGASAPRRGGRFNDSDVYKWLEAAAWSLAAQPDPALEAEVSAVIESTGAVRFSVKRPTYRHGAA